MIDIHVHLQDPCLHQHLDAILAQTQRLGVATLVCNGTTPSDWPTVRALAEQHRCVIPCFGIHPWYVSHAPPGWEDQLVSLLTSQNAAVGEIGIDRWIEPRDESRQEDIFRRQLRIAHDLRRPAMIHCLRAWAWLQQILAEEKLPPAMLIHSYGGSVELIEELVAYNAFFSFSGSIFEPRREKARAALLAVPPDRLLLETDAPDMLPPESHRTHQAIDDTGAVRNHPANLARIYEGVAQLLGCSITQLQQQLAANAARLLGDLLDDNPETA